MTQFVLDKWNLFLPMKELAEHLGVQFNEWSTFTLLGQSVQLSINHRAISRWAAMYLTPFCAISDEDADMAFYAIVLPDDVSITVHLDAQPEPSSWYYKQQGLCWKISQSRNLVCSLTSNAYYLVDNARKHILYLASGNLPQVYKEPARMINLMLLARLTAQGYLTLHASAAASGQQGIVFLGEKGSGKTTLLLRLIEHFGYGYLTNDQILLHADENGQVRLYGLPGICRIGIGTMKSIPSLETHIHLTDYPFEGLLPAKDLWRVEKKVAFTPYELGVIMGCPIVPSAVLQAAVFPQIASLQNRSEITVLSPTRARQRLNPMVLNPNPHVPGWLEFNAPEETEKPSTRESVWKNVLRTSVYQASGDETGLVLLNDLLSRIG